MPHWKIMDEEAEGGPKEITRRETLAEAELRIAQEARINREKVERGGYGIDGPCPDPGETIVCEGGEDVVGPRIQEGEYDEAPELRLRGVIRSLLNTAELNMDDLEPETIKAIIEAEDVLSIT